MQKRRYLQIKKQNNNNKGNFILPGQIITMEAFAQAIKFALQAVFPDCRIEIKDANGSLGHDKLLTIASPDASTSHVFPLSRLFMEYTAGGNLAKISNAIIEAYKEIRDHEDSFLESLQDYGTAENSVCYRLANLDKIRRQPVPVPHIPFLDMAVVFYIPFAEESGWYSTITVTDSLMRGWRIHDTNSLYASAHRNTCRMLPARMESMAGLLGSLLPEQEIPDINELLPLFVVSNNTRLHGASVILYDGLLKASADLFGDDLFILPSSIHEMLFMPASVCSRPEALKDMVLSVNQTELDEDDVLSNNVYFYDRKIDKLKII